MKWEGYERGAADIRNALERAFSDTLHILTREYTFTISTPGLFPGYVGDIVDYGFFRASLGRPNFKTPAPGVDYRGIKPTAPDPKILPEGLEGVFTWHAEYSALLHDGYTSHDGTTHGGREWTTETHKRIDVDEVFAKLFRKYAGT